LGLGDVEDGVRICVGSNVDAIGSATELVNSEEKAEGGVEPVKEFAVN
jgi:hypothetical protein